MQVAGVSTRKVKKALKAITGDAVKLSRSTVSRITKCLRDEYAAQSVRSLADLKVIYIFFDAIHVGMRTGVMDPLLCISDGNMGLCSMIDQYFPTSYRQRCVKHKMENILNQIPKEKHKDVRAKLNQIFYGAPSLEQAKQTLQPLATLKMNSNKR